MTIVIMETTTTKHETPSSVCCPAFSRRCLAPQQWVKYNERHRMHPNPEGNAALSGIKGMNSRSSSYR